jgi:glycosyltransferase involved in cell wall biosynthesis
VGRPSASDVSLCFVAGTAQLGGAELYLESLLRSLEPDRVDDVVMLANGPFVARLRHAGVTPTVIPCPRRTDLPRAALRLRGLLRERSTQVIHANDAKAALVAVLASYGTSTRVLWHRHDPTHDGRIGRWIARRCALVVGVSSSALGRLARATGVRAEVVTNGVPEHDVDRREARASLLGELAALAETQVTGIVGRLHPGKGQLELLEIANDLRARLPDIRLVFVGAPDPNELTYARLLDEHIERHGLEGFVSFLGYREDAVALIAGCDVLAIPSLPHRKSGWREGFSLVAAEAMRVGTPVVGYAEPALVEVLGPCAELVETGNRQLLREAIVDVLRHSDRREQLTECGRARVRQLAFADALARMEKAYVTAWKSPAGPDRLACE